MRYKNIKTGRIIDIPSKMVSKFFICLDDEQKTVDETIEKPKPKKKKAKG